MEFGSCATSTEQNREVVNEMVPFNISALPSFQSVHEMGYPVESIKEVFLERGKESKYKRKKVDKFQQKGW